MVNIIFRSDSKKPQNVWETCHSIPENVSVSNDVHIDTSNLPLKTTADGEQVTVIFI